MSQITARLPDDTVRALDAAAAAMRRSRAEIVRQAIELYLEDYTNLSAAMDAPLTEARRTDKTEGEAPCLRHAMRAQLGSSGVNNVRLGKYVENLPVSAVASGHFNTSA